jgi:hypothetical protein
MTVELEYGHHSGLRGTTLVDDDIAALIAGRQLRRHGPHIFVGGQALHRIVMGCTRGDGKVVHHINEDPADNRRQNLKVLDSMLAHGAEPHYWRDRLCSLLQHFSRSEAEQILNEERVDQGLRAVL